VKQPLAFAMDDLVRFRPCRAFISTECSGNGLTDGSSPRRDVRRRTAFYRRAVDGVPAATLLEKRHRSRGKWVLFEGAKSGACALDPHGKVLDDAILAYAMTASACVRERHPVRVVIPAGKQRQREMAAAHQVGDQPWQLRARNRALYRSMPRQGAVQHVDGMQVRHHLASGGQQLKGPASTRSPAGVVRRGQDPRGGRVGDGGRNWREAMLEERSWTSA